MFIKNKKKKQQKKKKHGFEYAHHVSHSIETEIKKLPLIYYNVWYQMSSVCPDSLTGRQIYRRIKFVQVDPIQTM
jgi:hypothetical protein